MILRKPYAFLIKHFKLINTILFLLMIYIFVKTLGLHSFVKEYLQTGIYSPSIESVANYADIYFYIASIGIIIITLGLAYLLKYKEKPIVLYLYTFFSYTVIFGVIIYTHTYFNGLQYKETFEIASVMAIRDLLFIISLPQYPALFLLLIRSLGIDLKRFGFSEDKEFVEINSNDNEEFELEVAFNKDRVIRSLKRKIRHLKYYIQEHKLPAFAISLVVALFLINGIYQFVYVENKIYKMNQTITSNDYGITVKNTYITDRDYAGKIISKEKKHFVIVDVNVKNLAATDRILDIEKFYLYTGSRFYVPTIRFNESFSDLGNLFDQKQIPSKKTKNYKLIFEIDEPKKGDNFYLAYQSLLGSTKTLKIKIEISDISAFKTKGTKKIEESMSININEQEKKEFTVKSYELKQDVLYQYEKCYVNNCPIYEELVEAPATKKLLHLNLSIPNDTNQTFYNFLKKYGTIIYKIGDTVYTENIKTAINKTYRGNTITLIVDEKIANASSIELCFTIRSYQYFYKLKG